MARRVGKTITVTQTRYLSTYFDSEHRDNLSGVDQNVTKNSLFRTRYTIPIYFTVNGITDVKVFRKNGFG